MTPPTSSLALTRRTVVVAAGVGAAVVAAPVTLRQLAAPLEAVAERPRFLARADFAPHTGASFTATAGDRRIGLRLVEVVDLDGRPADEESFELVLEADEPVEQRTYDLARSGFASAPVFVVPSGPDGRRATATFNRQDGA